MTRFIKQIITFTGIFIIFICAVNINAADMSASGGFSVHAVIPDNQIDTRQTYFDLRMKPGEERTIELVIDNSRDDELLAEIRLNAASTGRNGLIIYTEPDIRDELMKVSITDVAELQTENVTIPAHSSKTVSVKIKMPEEPIDGAILGGIAVSGGEPENNTKKIQGVSLTNKITYITALKLTENDDIPAADFDLVSVTPELVNFKTAVIAVLKNKSARIVKDMKVNAEIFRKDSGMLLHSYTNDHAEMAPLSKGDFAVNWENKPLEKGVYRLKMTADYDSRTWEWDEEFTIGTEADNLNNEAVGLSRNYTWLYVFLGAVLLITVWFIAYRTGKHRKPNEDLQN